MGETRQRALERASSFTGQKSGLPPDTLQPSDCEITKNMLTERGTLLRAFGSELYGSYSGGSGRVSWLDLLAYRWLVQSGLSLGYEDAEDAATFTEVGTLESSTPIISDTYRGEMYMVNGTDMKVYPPGGTLRNLGLQSPIAPNSSVAAWADGSAGSLIDNAVYRVTFTYIDKNLNVESPGLNVRPNGYGICDDLTPGYYSKPTNNSGSDISSFTIDAATFSGVYNNTFNGTILADQSKITHVGVYMSGRVSTVNELVFRKVGERAVGDATPFAITAEATGVLLPSDNIPPPNKLRQEEAYNFITTGSFSLTGSVPSTVGAAVYDSIRFFRDSLFATGPRGLMFPALNTSVDPIGYDSVLYIHDSFQPDHLFDTKEVGNGDGQKCTGPAILRDSVLLVFKERSIYYASGTGLDTLVLRIMDSRRGAISRKTIQETPYGVLALDRSGVIMVSAVGPSQLISQDVEDIIDSINHDAADSCYSSYDAEKNRYYLSIPVDSSATPNKTIVYNVEEKTWNVLEGQEGASLKFGVSSSGYAKYLIGGALSGTLNSISSELVTTVNGAAMSSEYLSGPFYCGDKTKQKKAKFVYITAESNSDWTIDIEILPNFGQDQAYALSDINSNSLYAVWAASLADSGVNVGVFDESLFSGAKVRKQLKVPIMCVGYSFQVRITNRSTNDEQYGFRILAIALEASMAGK